ncbi:MAG: serine acetyltransferase [Lachnospiraceae bacterium]|nr:serine acetyltransferase [Lachnospiraceae bacterium]
MTDRQTDRQGNSPITLPKYQIWMQSKIKHYDPNKYWKMRDYVVHFKGGNKTKALYYLFRIKKCDAFNGASMGTHIGYGAKFKTPPILPHGLNGIIISHNAVIGRNAWIFHQVTIGEGNGGAPVIGDNCFIGAGAKIIGGIKIGNNVKIGAGCVISVDIPDNATVVMNHPRIIIRQDDQI